jgi:hypothetical protein
MKYSTNQINVSGQSTVYIAIKPVGATLFRQIAIPLTGGTPPPPPPPPALQGDLNQDRTVNTLDWSIMNGQWFTSNSQSDINADGLVNSLDFGLMNRNWGMSS